MRHTSHFSTMHAFLPLVYALALLAGCATEPGQEQTAIDAATIQIRFHEGMKQQDVLAASGQSLGVLPLAPIEHTDVTRILVDATYADTGQPLVLRFELTQKTSNAWEGSLPFLPRDQQLRFAAEAFDAEGTILFSGETLTTLTSDNQGVGIPLAPAQNQQTFDLPRMFRIAYPSEVIAGQEVQVIFTIEGNPGETLDYQITSAHSATPFSPATGSVTLTNTVADFVALYTAPEVSERTTFDHEVVLTAAGALSSVAVATRFDTTVVPRTAGIDVVENPRPSVRFNPVILRLTANGTAIPDAVELAAAVSDDGDPALRTYQWSYTPNEGTPAATFANGGASNPALFQGYTVDHQGTITLEVTDENGGKTTLYYELLPDQFTDAIEHDAVQGIAQIVAGNAHTCVRTGEGKVRCWGEAQFGQLGYGNTQDQGDARDRLPYTAGDVPLPEPVLQLVSGDNHTCARMQSGMVYCWGNNIHGQLGYGNTEHLGDGEPVTSFGYVTLGGPASKIAAAGGRTCAIMQDSGALRCWGRNDHGQLGYGHTNNIGDDEHVFAAGDVDLGVAIANVALGDEHTCALLATGSIRCWGRNDHGQLGYGHSDDIGDDEAIANLPDISLPGPVRKLVAGPLHTCVLLENSTVRCWGYGGDGRTGHGFRPASNHSYGDHSGELPSALSDIATGAPVTDIAAGDKHTCALLSNGQLECWGEGANGRLGYGNQEDQPTSPATGVDLQGTSAYRIAAGKAHTCALRSNGTARCWGAGASGRLGHGQERDVYSPAATGDIAIFEPTSPVAYSRSCREHLSNNPGAADGIYNIDPDGEGGAGAFEAYCDMTTDGGGWTLVQRTVWRWSESRQLQTNYATFYGNTIGSPSPGLAFRVAGKHWPALQDTREHLMVEVPRRASDGDDCSPLYYKATNGLWTIPAGGGALVTGATDPAQLFNTASRFSAADDGPYPTCINDYSAVPWTYIHCCYTCPSFGSGYWSDEPHPMSSTLMTPDLFGNTVSTNCAPHSPRKSSGGSYYGINAMEYYLR